MIYSGLTGNNSLIKKVNLEHVLSTILAHKPISRAKVAQMTGLNKVTVSSCVDYFLDKGIIYELGTTEASRGRPPTLIDFNQKSGIYVGIEVEFNELKIVVADLSGHQLEQHTANLQEKKPEYFIQFITQLLSDLKTKYHNYTYGIIGVGVALPGYYNVQTGIIEYIASLKPWNQFPIQSEMNKIDPTIPFFINTAVNAGAMGEIHKRRSNMPGVLVHVGGLWGLGVGICINGKIFAGNSGFAGRLGHSTINIDGKLCSCGNKGCWELYGSALALKQRLYAEDQHIHFYEITQRLHNKDPLVIQAIKELGYYQGIGLANVINAYNPDVISIGGYLGMLGDPLIDSIHATLKEVLPQRFLKQLSIHSSEFGEFGGSFGAISMVADNLASIFVNQSSD